VKRIFLFLLLSVFVISGTPANRPAQAQQYSVDVVASDGDPVPGTEFDAFSVLFYPSLSETGTVLLNASTIFSDSVLGYWTAKDGNIDLLGVLGSASPNGGGRTLDNIYVFPFANALGDFVMSADDYLDGADKKNNLWTGKAGDWRLVVLTGDPAPGTSGKFFNKCLWGFPNDMGNIAMYGSLQDSVGGSAVGLWRETGGTLELLALAGEPAPGLPGKNFYDFFLRGFNKAGQALFWSTLDAERTEKGIWTGTPGNLQLVAAFGPEGTIAPGTAQRFQKFQSFPLPFNDAGVVAFQGTLEGDANDNGIWAGLPGALQLIVRNGQEAPGTNGQTFVDVELSGLNNAGDILFMAGLESFSLALVRDSVWIRSGGQTQPIALKGGEIPGLPGHTFGNFISGAQINNLGEVVFEAGIFLDDTYLGDGTWAGRPGDLSLIARSGDVFETSTGEQRTLIGTFITPVLKAINDAGQVLMWGETNKGTFSHMILLVSKTDPAAVDDSGAIASGWRNREVTIDVLANDSEPFGGGLTVISTGVAANGTVTINDDNSVTYRRNWRFSEGCDSFAYTIRDGQAATAEGLVQVAVGDGTTCEPPAGPANTPPTADFNHTTTDLAASFTDASTDNEGKARPQRSPRKSRSVPVENRPRTTIRQLPTSPSRPPI
jgi:hypothetical protein